MTDDLFLVPEPEEHEELERVADVLSAADRVVLQGDDGNPVTLPPSAREGLARIVTHLVADVPVMVDGVEQVLTTQEAADLLGMSRPHLIHQLEARGIQIETTEPGRHRRIPLSAIRAYLQIVGEEGARLGRQRRLHRRAAQAGESSGLLVR